MATEATYPKILRVPDKGGDLTQDQYFYQTGYRMGDDFPLEGDQRLECKDLSGWEGEVTMKDKEEDCNGVPIYTPYYDQTKDYQERIDYLDERTRKWTFDEREWLEKLEHDKDQVLQAWRELDDSYSRAPFIKVDDVVKEYDSNSAGLDTWMQSYREIPSTVDWGSQLDQLKDWLLAKTYTHNLSSESYESHLYHPLEYVLKKICGVSYGERTWLDEHVPYFHPIAELDNLATETDLATVLIPLGDHTPQLVASYFLHYILQLEIPLPPIKIFRSIRGLVVVTRPKDHEELAHVKDELEAQVNRIKLYFQLQQSHFQRIVYQDKTSKGARMRYGILEDLSPHMTLNFYSQLPGLTPTEVSFGADLSTVEFDKPEKTFIPHNDWQFDSSGYRVPSSWPEGTNFNFCLCYYDPQRTIMNFKAMFPKRYIQTESLPPVYLYTQARSRFTSNADYDEWYYTKTPYRLEQKSISEVAQACLQKKYWIGRIPQPLEITPPAEPPKDYGKEDTIWDRYLKEKLPENSWIVTYEDSRIITHQGEGEGEGENVVITPRS